MKKTFAILLLSIHLFNICGYRLVLSFAERVANNHLIASLDENQYDNNELVEIKVALNMPYFGNRSDERFDGQIELNGIHYNYVKRTVQNDTLYLYCIPNKAKTEINKTSNLLARQNAESYPDKTSGHAGLKKTISIDEYNPSSLNFNLVGFTTSPPQTFEFRQAYILSGFAMKHLQPPDLFV